MKKCCTLIGVLFALASAQTEPTAVLQWMSGCWIAEMPHVQMEEHWSLPGGSSLIGYSRVISKGRTSFIEYSRIQTQGAVTVYHALLVAENRTTLFTMETCTPDSVRFVNPEHDFPREIAYYRLHADTLQVRLNGVENGAARSEAYRMHRRACEP